MASVAPVLVVGDAVVAQLRADSFASANRTLAVYAQLAKQRADSTVSYVRESKRGRTAAARQQGGIDLGTGLFC